jgi:hypothetical protein
MIILDCEASGLAQESYPIQIGWVNMFTKEEDSFYIRPAEDWVHWDEHAQDIHNIPRKLLYDVGLTVEQAAKRLTKSLGECPIFTDAPAFDGFWVTKLFEEAKLPLPFDFHSVYALVEEDKIEETRTELQSSLRPHDALDDVKAIIHYLEPAMEKYPSRAAKQLLQNQMKLAVPDHSPGF